MMHPSVALTVTGDVQDRAFEDTSVLARAGKLITEVVFDAASAIQTSKRRRAAEQRTLRLAKKEAPNKAKGHEGIPGWFKGSARGVVPSSPLTEANRRALRKQQQKQYHPNKEDEWLKVHLRYVDELEAAEAADGRGSDVIFYGDSITEEWRGTFLGAPWGPFADVKKVWSEVFASRPYTSLALGIAGDKAEHLLWRLQNGELPTSKHPKVVAIMIGTNDLIDNCALQAATETSAGIMEISSLLHTKLPKTHILNLAVLPKGEIWPNRCSEAILAVNSALEEFAKANPDFAHYADFGKAFLSDEVVGGRYEVKEALMPDSFHPSAAGMRIIASQLEPIVAALVHTPIGNAAGDADSATSR
ncbi:probable platelet-activating factor acetylhydrolase IB subunit beta [Coccomyxa sp. Obi]|nr:probable platelet-activating factor acetylhydrolase IB subunit beta [Coccomyxa sp. Obi]